MSKDCCETDKHDHKKKFDLLLWGTFGILVLAYFPWLFLESTVSEIQYLNVFSESIFELINRMSWGMVLSFVFVGLLERIPKDMISSVMGKGGSFLGIVRATFAGVLLDLCSHGILVVGAKLYKRGLSLGQTMAFLIASPWNSFSLTLILWALVGFEWMMAFLVLSLVIAIISGMIFDQLVKRGIVPKNPNTIEVSESFSFWNEFKKGFRVKHFHPKYMFNVLWDGIKGSKMILRWIFLGTILASLIRTFLSTDHFQTLFGPTLAGLGLTLIVATIIEVCSEGSTPIAADILTRAKAPGNAFGFLMAGVSTDYTEILTVKEATKSWKIAFLLPLVTLPQIIVLSILLNGV